MDLLKVVCRQNWAGRTWTTPGNRRLLQELSDLGYIVLTHVNAERLGVQEVTTKGRAAERLLP